MIISGNKRAKMMDKEMIAEAQFKKANLLFNRAQDQLICAGKILDELTIKSENFYKTESSKVYDNGFHIGIFIGFILGILLGSFCGVIFYHLMK